MPVNPGQDAAAASSVKISPVVQGQAEFLTCSDLKSFPMSPPQ